MLLAKFKVSGHSMQPFLNPEDEALFSNLPYLFKAPKTGDVIAFKSGGEYIVKRIKQVKKNKYLVKGDNEKDSKNYGWLRRQEIIGKLVLKI